MKPNLKQKRLQLGLTLEEVGKMVGVGKSTVRKWETGDIENMKRDKIVKLANALQVSPLYIMGMEEEEQTEPKYNTIAAHIDENVTEEELEEIVNYIEFRKRNRK